MVLCDRDIKKRLKTPDDLALPKDYLALIAKKEMPSQLRDALENGLIVMDPIPPDNWFDGDTVDIAFGCIIEMPDMPLEVVTIEGKEVIRRFTNDFRWDGSPKSLHNVRKVSRAGDGSRVRFNLSNTDTLELQPDMQALVYSLQAVCVPFDLQMTLGGRSRVARNFVDVHASSPIIHPGWCGHVVMEVTNRGKMSQNLYPGLAFGVIGFNQMSGKPDTPYCDKGSASFSGQR
ncbi:MAG: hypothetical protein HYT39_00495 [Candidatus Sungbacteria bacterium]|nr:hypothetical protein [Candidatus Sungbacteria bacterium]